MKNTKRIHSVTIKRMYDDSPDLSWLGEYGSSPDSEFSIDRAHHLDCSLQPFNKAEMIDAPVEQLERAIAYLNSVLDTIPDFTATWRNEGISDAQDILIASQDEIADECTCGGQFLERNSYQYFNPNYQNYKGCERAEIIKYCLQDFARAESGNRGDWCMIGIRAEAEIRFPYMTEGRGGRTYYKTEPITSGGLWGVESDSGDDYLEDIEQEQLAELKHELTAIGFSKRAISTAFKSIEESGDAR